MIRATAGTWVNYATTLAFQVILAARLGATLEASAFVVGFSLATALSGIFANVVVAIAVPRLGSPSGAFEPAALKFMTGTIAVGGALAIALSLPAPWLAGLVLPKLPGRTDEMVFLAALALFVLQMIAASLVGVQTMRGQRLLPAVAPALPSTTGAVALVLGVTSPDGLLLAYAIGSLAEVTILIPGLFVRRGPTAPAAKVAPLGRLGFITAVQFALFGLILPCERVVTGRYSPSGAAQYFYASRSLSTVQQLILGGMALSSFGDWTRLSRTGDPTFLQSIVSRLASAAALLIVAASCAGVAGHSLVALVYQHGKFSSEDTTIITTVMLLSLTGFVADGVGWMLAQAFLATHQNHVAIQVGFVHVLVRIPFIIIFGLRWGPKGVAVAYSTAMVITLAFGLYRLANTAIFSGIKERFIGSNIYIQTVVAATGMVLAIFIAMIDFPQSDLFRGGVVLGGALVMFVMARSFRKDTALLW